MEEAKKEVRKKWLHIRLNETELNIINSNWQKTTTRELSDYARRVLLKKPVTFNHRNQSADEILAEMIRLKAELHAIGNNFNQAVHKLHTLDTIPQIRIWLLANERGALLLTTSNRSEAAVGYATMDGDTCGGLCPIGGIDKNFLRSWLRWAEKIGPDGFHPLPVLILINEQEPTAELRPPDKQGNKQTDEKVKW